MDGLLALSEELAAAVERAAQAVVAVHGRRGVASTGIHWRSGVIVTANHTLEIEEGVAVTTPDGRSAPVTVLGREPALDLALLKVEAAGIAVAEVADSDRVRVGHSVLAVGAGPRASWGVVSAIGPASSRASDAPVFSLDLTLYPGFSGGPLVDARGAVVGLNTSGASRQRQLAIPANAVSRVTDDVARQGRIRRAWLGVGTQPVRVPGQGGDDQRTAVIVVEVQPGSPASESLLVGDVILALGGTAVADPLDLRAILRPDRIGERLRVSILRAGRATEVEVMVGERPPRSR